MLHRSKVVPFLARLTLLDNGTTVVSISQTLRRLQSVQEGVQGGCVVNERLRPLPDFGSNPGALKCFFHIPDDRVGLAMVVVLHGCTQTAMGYDAGAGWSALGDRHGFAVLCPQQTRANNPNLCFNWFNPEDTRRGGGEAASISEMIDAMVSRHAIDRSRIFITGLSAGGAMTSVMLATYPELFAGGGIIAGLPYGSATSVPEALQSMGGKGRVRSHGPTSSVRTASTFTGPWPRISVWHGDADQTVRPVNADWIIDQWRDVHETAVQPDRIDVVDGQQRLAWVDDRGVEVIESYRITGMGHGTPLDTRGAKGCGSSGAHMLEAGISSTRHLAAWWGIIACETVSDTRTSATMSEKNRSQSSADGRTIAAQGVQATIERALRLAGLLK